METNLPTGISSSKQKSIDSKVRLRRIDNLIFIICLIIAAVFWTLIKFTQPYSPSYTFDVRYNNVPVEKKMTSLDDSTVAITINAQGFTIFRLWLFEDLTRLSIDLNNFTIDKREDKHYFVYTQEMKDNLSDLFELPEGTFEFSKTTLGFVLEDLKGKKVQVRDKLDLKFRKEYDLYEQASISPEEVMVYGPAPMLDSIDFVYTQSIQQTLLENDISMEIGLDNPDTELLRFEPEVVTVNLRIEQYTESSIDIPIDFSGIDMEIKSFPSIVRVNYQIARKDFTLVQPGQFQVVPEIRGVDLTKTDKLHLKLVRQPEIVRNPWIVPADIEFLIIK